MISRTASISGMARLFMFFAGSLIWLGSFSVCLAFSLGSGASSSASIWTAGPLSMSDTVFSSSPTVKVALTREMGANEKMDKLLSPHAATMHINKYQHHVVTQHLFLFHTTSPFHS